MKARATIFSRKNDDLASLLLPAPPSEEPTCHLPGSYLHGTREDPHPAVVTLKAGTAGMGASSMCMSGLSRVEGPEQHSAQAGGTLPPHPQCSAAGHLVSSKS